jgi:hypothetical protein
VKPGVQDIYKSLRILESGFHRNDEFYEISTFYKAIVAMPFYETIKICGGNYERIKFV